MKKLFVIRPHSFVDLITNSSSEVFVYTGDKSVELVIEALKAIVKKYNEKCEEHKRHPIPNFYDQPCKFNSTFGDIFEVTPRGMKGLYEGYSVQYGPGDIIIESFDDNSIPWNVQEEIEEILGAKRYHLG